MLVRRGLAVAAVCSLPLSLLAVHPSGSVAAEPEAPWFERTATYPVYLNVPEGVDLADETVAEISTITPDGNTVIYTDAAGQRIGFVDVTDPSAPVGDGTIDLTQLGDADDQPTSVAALGDYVMVVIDESGGDYVNPSGRVDVVRLSDRTVVRSIDLGGQPDSIAVSPDGDYAAIAMENQRDEDVPPVGSDEEGDLPQLPAGTLQVLGTSAADPADWTLDEVPLTQAGGDALPVMVDAGIYAPTDPEPEYVDINDEDQLVLTLQENNGLVVVDLPTLTITHAFSAGNAKVSNVDTTDDGVFNAYDSIDVPREPDAVAWVGDDLVATANEGDLFGGSRGWSVFDVTDGSVVWDAGTAFENTALALGLFNDGRADNKGAEPEGIAFDVIDGVPTAFVGSERSNFVAVYDMTDPTRPQFRQALPTTNGPEGLLPVPDRDLFVVSSETDDAEAGVRATVSLYQLGSPSAQQPDFPQIYSRTPLGDGTPVGWGALGALTGDLADPDVLWAASDSAYATGRIYKVDVSEAPAVIKRAMDVSDAEGDLPGLDIEGLAARPDGGFWLAIEGTGDANRIIRTNGRGVIQETVSLPTEVTDHVRNWGLEGVTVQGSGADEVVTVVVQRPLWVDPFVGAGSVEPLEGDYARIGRYSVADGTWTWFLYPLSTTTVEGDWIGLSEITAIDEDTFAVIERDKLNGPAAALKRIYTVDLPAGSPSTPESPTTLTKRLAVDVLPTLRSTNGWTQEKLEGLGLAADGSVYVVTDNDGLDDATGETNFFRLGTARQLFRPSLRTATRIRAPKKSRSRVVPVTVNVLPADEAGTVALFDRRTLVRRISVDGPTKVRVRLGTGKHVLRARYLGDTTSLPSQSPAAVVTVRR